MLPPYPTLTRLTAGAFGLTVPARVCVAASRAEAGVLHYDLWRETEGEQRYFFNELYVDDDAVAAHMASDHFKAFGLAARDLAAARPLIIKTLAIDVAD